MRVAWNIKANPSDVGWVTTYPIRGKADNESKRTITNGPLFTNNIVKLRKLSQRSVRYAHEKRCRARTTHRVPRVTCSPRETENGKRKA